MLQTDQPAPAFNLVDTDKANVSLTDYQGKNLVLLFFPFAYSGVCDKEVCLIRDDLAAYEGLNAEVLAVSVDSHYALKKFKEDHGLNFTLASDFNKEAMNAYGVVHETFGSGYMGVAKRSAFVIDAEGVIKHVEVLDNPGELPDFDRVKSALAQIQ